MKNTIEKIKLTNRNGKPITGRKITVTSTFDISADKIWNRLLNIGTLIEICKPKMTFKICCAEMPEKWEIRKVYLFKLFVYGFIPIGKHEILLERIDDEKKEILSREHNKAVTVWNHLIRLEPTETNKTTYTDEVVLYAGIFTYFAALWSISFYRHRQRQWSKIVKRLNCS